MKGLKHRIQKRNQNKNDKRDFRDIGSIIKKRRLELEQTQDETCSGICSISYLSKIENNQIVPSEFYVKEITAKLDIDSDVIAKTLYDKHYVNEMIDAMFHQDDERVAKIYGELQDIEHNVAINLCKLAFVVYQEQRDDNQYVMMLEHVVTNMTDLEVQLYLYVASRYFVQLDKHRTAHELITLYETMTPMDETLDAMVHDLGYRVRVHLGQPTKAAMDYAHAMTIYQRHHNAVRMVRLALVRIHRLALEDPVLALDHMKTLQVDYLRSEDVDFLHYTRAIALHELGRDQEATLELKRLSADSWFRYRKATLLYEICLAQGDVDMADKLKEMLQEESPHPREMKAKIHYHYLIQENDEEKKHYLRDIAIPFAIRIEDPALLERYIKAVMAICVNGARYKEAMQFYQKLERERDKNRPSH